MRAVIVSCLLAASARADELPTIESETPPALRLWSESWNVRFESLAVDIRSAPETTFVTLAVTSRREQSVDVPIDVPAGTQIIGLGLDGVDGRVWGRPMAVGPALVRQASGGGAVAAWKGTSAGQDHIAITVTAPATIELALRLPPLSRLEVATNASVARVAIGGELRSTTKRTVLDLEDIAGTTGALALPALSDEIALVASPTPASDFFERTPATGMRGQRDLDKAMIRRRMTWFRPGLKQCFMQVAQWTPGLTHGGTVITFLIDESGNVAFAKASESDLPAAVTDCLARQVTAWEFPASDGRVLVNYPLTFTASE